MKSQHAGLRARIRRFERQQGGAEEAARGRRAAALVAAIVSGLLVGSAATALASGMLPVPDGWAAQAPSEQAAGVESRWSGPVPAEWRWSPRGVDVDRMFPKPREQR